MNRYKHTKKKNRKYLTCFLPKVKKDSNDVYIITKEWDRLDQLAEKYYNDVSLWWLIVRANPELNLAGSLALSPGLKIRIPVRYNKIIEDLDIIY